MSMKQQQNRMEGLGELLSHNLGYIGGERESGPNGAKKDFLNKGTAFLRELGKDLRFSEMKVFKNPAGIAVSGEVTLMGVWSENNGLYLQLSEPSFGNSCVLYRRIKNLKDYRGEGNLWMGTHFLKNERYGRLIEVLQSLNRKEAPVHGYSIKVA